MNAKFFISIVVVFASNLYGFEIGEIYQPSQSVELKKSPSRNAELLINQKASKYLKEPTYLSVNDETQVVVDKVEGDWVFVQVVSPKHLSSTHKGWLKKQVLNKSSVPSLDYVSGWIKNFSYVYGKPSKDSEKLGYILDPTAVTILGNEGEWLQLSKNSPVRDLKTYQVIPELESPLYIKAEHFTTELPSTWIKK